MAKRNVRMAMVAATVSLQMAGAGGTAMAAVPEVTFQFSPTSGVRGAKIDFTGTGCPHDAQQAHDGFFMLPDGQPAYFSSDAAGNFAGQYDTAQNGEGAYTTGVTCLTTGKSAVGGTFTITRSGAETSGSTWYSDGLISHAGAPGTQISAYAVGAFTNVPYRLVLGTGDASHACATTVQVLNPALRYANSRGFISTTVGSVGPGLAPGTYKLCFEDSSSGNSTGTGGATFTVLAPT